MKGIEGQIRQALSAPLKNVIYFEERGYLKPHFYIILPSAKEIIILAMISSQVLKIQRHSQRKESLIFLDKKDVSILTKQSVIDCTKAFRIELDELLSKQKLKVVKADVSKDLIIQIAKVINKNPLAKPALKKSIDLSKI